MKRLDKKRPFGRVCGAGKAKFEQDGVLFDVHGNELMTDEQRAAWEAEEAERQKLATEEAEKAAKAGKGGAGGKKAAEKPADPATTDSAVDDQLSAQGAV